MTTPIPVVPDAMKSVEIMYFDTFPFVLPSIILVICALRLKSYPFPTITMCLLYMTFILQT